MSTQDLLETWHKYRTSFEDFARDLFDVETTCDMTANLVEYSGHEDLVLAHLMWNLFFTHDRTFVVVCPNQRMAHYWSHKAFMALQSIPKFMNPGVEHYHNDAIQIANGNNAYFRILNENTCRGMAIQGLYIIEPDLVGKRKHDEFMKSVIPTMVSSRHKQIIRCSRGY